jgi:hypothetical protein
MKHRKRNQRLAITVPVVMATVAAALTAVIVTAPTADAATGPAWPVDTWGTPTRNDNVVLKWDEQLLSVIRAYPPQTGPTIAARALGVVHTAMYDAWAAYDKPAIGTTDPTVIDTTKRTAGPTQQILSADPAVNNANKMKAISFAAYRAIVDLFPPEPGKFPSKAATATTPAYTNPNVLMTRLPPDGFGYDPAEVDNVTPDVIDTPAEVGNAAANAVLDYRHGDGSNQLGGYADTTGYRPAEGSTWNSIVKWRWQPLCVLTPAGVQKKDPPVRDPSLTCPDTPPETDPPTLPSYTVQKPLTPQWRKMTPFNVRDTDPTTHLPYQFNNQPFNPPELSGNPDEYDPADIDQALRDTSSLTDAQKATAEYWADGPGSEFPPGHMAVFAQALSRMRGNKLDQDIKLFFALGNALMDASISSWTVKYDLDFWRPVTAIRHRYRDKKVNSWLGPNKGYGTVLGQNWQPYQQLNVVTPGFPEYVSGHSTFSAAGRNVLISFFGADSFNAKVTIKAGTSKFESNTPAKDVVLSWKTLSDASNQAGMSRRYGGIHFKSGDEHGRSLGSVIGYNDYNLAQRYITGTFKAGVDDTYNVNR